MSKNAAIYAEQLFAIARHANYLEEARADINTILLGLKEQPKFLELLMAPSMKKEAKQELILSTFSQETSKVIIDFLLLLAKDGNFDQLEEIGALYSELVSQYLEDYFGIVEGTVYSAVSLSDSELAQLTHVFTKKTGKKVRLNLEIDESLIGGYKVSVANMVYDSTIKLQLKQLKDQLMKVDLG